MVWLGIRGFDLSRTLVFENIRRTFFHTLRNFFKDPFRNSPRIIVRNLFARKLLQKCLNKFLKNWNNFQNSFKSFLCFFLGIPFYISSSFSHSSWIILEILPEHSSEILLQESFPNFFKGL